MEANSQVHAPAVLSPVSSLRYLENRRIGWPQNRSGRCGEDNILSSLPGIELWFLRRPAISQHYTDLVIPAPEFFRQVELFQRWFVYRCNVLLFNINLTPSNYTTK
jgi:hypothetical protein